MFVVVAVVRLHANEIVRGCAEVDTVRLSFDVVRKRDMGYVMEQRAQADQDSLGVGDVDRGVPRTRSIMRRILREAVDERIGYEACTNAMGTPRMVRSLVDEIDEAQLRRAK